MDISEFYTQENQREEILSHLSVNGKVENLEMKFKTIKGNEFCGLLSVVSIIFNDEECFMGMVKDITLQKEQELKLALQSKMEALGKMIGNIAHQWRQPLSSISMIASSIQVQKELGIVDMDELSTNMENIVKKTEYLSETINTFRDFIKEDKVIKEVVLQDRIDEALYIVQLVLRDKNIELQNNIDYENKIKIVMAVGELSQVIVNILNNAIEAILENDVKKPYIKLDLIKEDNNTIISIEDNGGGIPADVLPRIFEPYFTTKHQSQGTGLGLHMSYQIVTESLNGKMWIENTKNGAKFFISLPVS